MRKRLIMCVFIAWVLVLFDISEKTDIFLAMPIPLLPILGGVSVASSLFGGIMGGQAARKNQGIIDKMSRENDADYFREYYKDALDNPSSKSYLKRLDNRMKDTDKATENNAIASNATQENVLAQKKANNEVMSDAISGLVERSEGRKDAIRENYLNRKNSIQTGQMGQNTQKANNWMNVTNAISQAAGGLASAYLMSDGKLFDKKKPVDNNTTTTSTTSNEGK